MGQINGVGDDFSPFKSYRTKTYLGPSLLVQHVVKVCSVSPYVDSQDTEGRRRSVRDAEP